MVLKTGDMFTSGADVLVVTTNSTLRGDGALVMGRGAAKIARDSFRGCDKVFGNQVRNFGETPARKGISRFDVAPAYGILIHPQPPLFESSPILAIFQVKHYYGAKADPELIVASCDVLSRLAREQWLGLRIALNFPGIGNGGLDRVDVLPLLLDLPDNVEVWEREDTEPER